MPPQSENNTPTNPILLQKPRSNAFLLVLTFFLFITGVFGVWYFSNPLPEEEVETVAVINKFADWKTYRNEEYGFELNLPSKWSVFPDKSVENELLNLVLNVPSEGSTSDNVLFILRVSSLNSSVDLSKWFYDNAEFNNSSVSELIQTTDKIYGKDFLKYSDFSVNVSTTSIDNNLVISQTVKCLKSDCYFLGGPQNHKEYFFRKGNLLFHLETKTMFVSEDFTKLDQIFSTFKFISTSTNSNSL